MSLSLLEAAAAKLEGKRVEVDTICKDVWVEWNGQSWSQVGKYRIAPEPKKKVKFLCWYDGYELRWRGENDILPPKWQRVPSEDKEVEIED